MSDRNNPQYLGLLESGIDNRLILPTTRNSILNNDNRVDVFYFALAETGELKIDFSNYTIDNVDANFGFDRNNNGIFDNNELFPGTISSLNSDTLLDVQAGGYFLEFEYAPPTLGNITIDVPGVYGFELILNESFVSVPIQLGNLANGDQRQLEGEIQEVFGIDGTPSLDVYSFTLSDGANVILTTNDAFLRPGTDEGTQTEDVDIILAKDNGDGNFSLDDQTIQQTLGVEGRITLTADQLQAGDYFLVFRDGGGKITGNKEAGSRYSATLSVSQGDKPQPNPNPPDPDPIIRQTTIPVELLSTGANSDVVGRGVGSFRPLTSIVDKVYKVTVSQNGSLAVINTDAPIEPFLPSTTIPPEGSSIPLNNQATAKPTNGISFTLASDTNNNGLLDSSDQFHDFEDPNTNVAGTVIFNKSVSPGTYFIEVNDTNGSFSSLDRFLIFNDPGGTGLELDIIPDPRGEKDSNPEPEPEPQDLLETDIFRFQNTNVPGTYLYAAAEEAQNIRENFKNFEEEGFAFQVGVEPGDDLIPLYRFQSNIIPGTYIFVGEEERIGIKENFSEQFEEEGLAFYVYGVGANQGTPFSRFQNTDLPGTYLFASPGEAESIEANFPNFFKEGLAFEVDI